MRNRLHLCPSAFRAAAAALLLACPAGAYAYAPPAAGPLRQISLPAVKTAAAPPATRTNRPLHAVVATAPGQAGYVHYFLLRMPDESLEIQVGIELDDQRIAWSFPDMGVTISPFIETGSVEAGGRTYEVWHLYGLRPFPDDPAMTRLRRELPARVGRWIKAGLPYCLDDGPRANCISCLGFVMRALFPSRNGYPDIPADFSRTRGDQKYTPNELLLYLTGMLDLSDRNARLQRLNQMALPPDLRDDLEKLVYSMSPVDANPANAAQRRAAAPVRSLPARRRL